MPCRWYIDECSATRISGWIDDDGPVTAIDIAVNGRRVATLAPTAYRKDLEEAGMGDGKRAFSVPIARFLVEPVNRVSISREGEVLHSATVMSASARAAGIAPAAAASPAAGVARGGRDANTVPLLTGDMHPIHRDVTTTEECDFYHIVELPDGTTTRGQWDLRKTADAYLGNVDFAGKRVIEIGPASGFLSFHMERRGARVAVIEPPMESFWDLVPQAAVNLDETRRSFGRHIQRVRNSFWYLHHCYESSVECYEIDAYHIPPQPTKFDIGVLASILLHISSPVRMLESVASVVANEIVIVERYFPELADQAVCRLVPTAANRSLETWWEFSPKFFEQFLAVLGFSNVRITHHRQQFATIDQEWEMFTIVGTR